MNSPHRTSHVTEIIPSTRSAEAHFDAKARRWHNALAAAPHARRLEQLAFMLGIARNWRSNPLRAVAADLFCGSGYLSEALDGCFKLVVGVDVSQEMLRAYPTRPGYISVRAGLEGQAAAIAHILKPDLIVSLAGIHHVFQLAGPEKDPERGDSLQAELVSSWAKLLPPGGLMIIADVTDPESPPLRRRELPQPNGACAPILEQRFRELAGGVWWADKTSLGLIVESTLPSMDQYIDAVDATFPGLATASPGRWFREVVDHNGEFGHKDHFPRPEVMIQALEEAGLEVAYSEVPVPWLFETEEQFTYFSARKIRLQSRSRVTVAYSPAGRATNL